MQEPEDRSMQQPPQRGPQVAVWLAVAGGTIAGCAGRNMLVHTHNYAGHIAGFWAGLLHGLVAPISLVSSVFMDINIYEVHNTGFFYNLGFVLGMSTWIRAAALRIAAGQAHDRHTASATDPSHKAGA